MADVDLYPKQVTIADKIQKASVDLMTALRALEALDEEYQSSGLNLSGVSFITPDASQAVGKQVQLKGCTGDDVLACLTSGEAVKGFCDGNFHSTNFDKVKP